MKFLPKPMPEVGTLKTPGSWVRLPAPFSRPAEIGDDEGALHRSPPGRDAVFGFEHARFIAGSAIATCHGPRNAALRRPRPHAYGQCVVSRGVEYPDKYALISSGVSAGSSARSSAATPLTCGAAIDVPFKYA